MQRAASGPSHDVRFYVRNVRLPSDTLVCAQSKAGETVRAMDQLHANLNADFMLLLQLQNFLLHEVRTAALIGDRRPCGRF